MGIVESFVTEFTKRAMSLFGSGWVWLYVDGSSEGEPELLVTTTANQDTPAMIVCAPPGLLRSTWALLCSSLPDPSLTP